MRLRPSAKASCGRKTASASAQTLYAIQLLRRHGALAALPEALQQAAAIREEYPTEPLKELAAQKTEAENLQIVQLVRSMRLTPQELTAMLAGGGIPGIAPIPADYEEQEETENEE